MTTFRNIFEAYIGFINSENEGTFAWTSGKLSNVTFWYPDEPNNHGGNEDCTVVRGQDRGINSWNDVPCELSKAFICEQCLVLWNKFE